MAVNLKIRAYRLSVGAAKLPLAEREAFFSAHAATDPEAVALGARMLANRELDTSDELEPAVPLPEWLRDRKGTVVNGWTIHEDLGFGGFARVYRATRETAGSAEEAAIKFLALPPVQVPRFEWERQTLATLNHANICKYIDGGEEAGVPFIVMERVTGLPIDVYCSGKTLTERLKLFVQLLDTIAYAHRKGVLHRDLKPANILVTHAGVVSVLDFGLAKMLESDASAPVRLTRTGQYLFTKAYASPEQVNGGPLGMATDVYSLGVVLYQMVTGHLPLSEFALQGPDWMKIVAEREPLLPSQAIMIDPPEPAPGGASSRPPETATPPRVFISRLKKAVRGDLDAVILHALKKDPGDRYTRVDRLRSDIEQFLTGSSVTVRRARWWERLIRWGSHHRRDAAIIAASFLCVIYEVQRIITREFDAVAEIYYERDAIRRIQYLTEAALPQIEDALPPNPRGRDARRIAAQIHTNLLWRSESLANYILLELDASLGMSALRCVREWEALEDPQSALAVIGPMLPRIVRRYKLDGRDRPWRELYEQLLREEAAAHSRLHQDAEAAEATRQLAAIERKVR